MDDVLDMQREYLEKKDKNFTPAAQVISSKKSKRGLQSNNLLFH